MQSAVNPGNFQRRWGRQPKTGSPPTYYLAKFAENYMNMKKIGPKIRTHPKFYYVDPPLAVAHHRYGFFSDYFMMLLFTCACIEGHIRVGGHLEKERQQFVINVYFLCK